MSFIVLDGPDGSGKSTQIKLLAEHLETRGENVLCIREPGQTPLGEDLRHILLHATYDISSLSEVFLFNAARSQMMEEIVKPAIDEGKWILCDRFYPSTLVYQSFAGGQNLAVVRSICEHAVAHNKPDHIIVLDVPVETTQLRLGDDRDRIESKGEDYLKNVRDGFLELATTENWPVISASESIVNVHSKILNHLF